MTALLLGCEEEVITADPTGYPFEVYGLLDPTADTQFVRVFPIETHLQPNRGQPLDATVTAADLTGGGTIPWNDSLVAYDDGTYGYLFWAPFRPEGDHTYRVDVTRSDGARSSAEVSVPALPEPQAPSYEPAVTWPLFIAGDSLRVRVIEIEYLVQWSGCPEDFGWFTYTYTDQVQHLPDGVHVDLHLEEEVRDIQVTIAQEEPVRRVYYNWITLRLMVTNGDWAPPGDTLDPEVLIQPGTMTNVENGFGFIGSGYQLETQLDPPDEALRAAGWTLSPPQECN